MEAIDYVTSLFYTVLAFLAMSGIGLLGKYLNQLKEKYEIDSNPDLFELEDIARNAVLAAEQKFSEVVGDTGNKKKLFVLGVLRERFPSFPDNLLDAYVESQVFKLNAAKESKEVVVPKMILT